MEQKERMSIKDRTSVLVVNDDANTRELMATALSDRYRCTTAASAEEAARLLAVAPFDVVITDLIMPGASGIDLCHHVRKTCPTTAVLVVSVVYDDKARLEALSSGACGFLTKPLDIADLEANIEAALSPPRA